MAEEDAFGIAGRAGRVAKARGGILVEIGPFVVVRFRGEQVFVAKNVRNRLRSIGKIHTFVQDVIIESRRRREKADDLHLFGARVVEHMDDALRK